MYAIKTVFQDNVIIHEAIRTLINIKIKHENEGGKGGGGWNHMKHRIIPGTFRTATGTNRLRAKRPITSSLAHDD